MERVLSWVEKIATYYVENNSTIRRTAEEFDLAKTYVWELLMCDELASTNPELFNQVDIVRKRNISERCSRGGVAKLLKYGRVEGKRTNI